MARTPKKPAAAAKTAVAPSASTTAAAAAPSADAAAAAPKPAAADATSAEVEKSANLGGAGGQPESSPAAIVKAAADAVSAIAAPVQSGGIDAIFGTFLHGVELVGAHILPTVIETAVATIPAGQAVATIASMTGLSAEGWNALPDPVRSTALQLGVKALHDIAGHVAGLRDAVTEPAADAEITGRSSDGKAYRRGGVVWTADDQTVTLPADQAAIVRADKHVLKS